MGINKISTHKVSLCAHNRFCTLSVSVCDLVIMRHTLVHLFQLFVKVSAFPVKHHKYRWGAKRPASVTSDTDGRSCHLLAGTAVKLTHSRNIIVHKKALDQVAFAQKIAPFLRRQLRMLHNGSQQERLQLHHLRNLPPRKEPSHQNQKRRRVAHQNLRRARVQPLEQILRRNGRKQVPRVFFDDRKFRVVVSGPPVSVQRVQILPVRAVPVAEAVPIGRLRRARQRAEFSGGALLHHVVETVVF